MSNQSIWQIIIGITAVAGLLLSILNFFSEKARFEGNIEARVATIEDSQKTLVSDTKKLANLVSAIRERVQDQNPNLPLLPSQYKSKNQQQTKSEKLNPTDTDSTGPNRSQ